MKDRKTILFILPWLPYPITSGGHQALYNGIAAVANDMDVQVTYVATDDAAYHQAEAAFCQRIPNVTLLPFFWQPQKGTIVQKCKRAVKKALRLLGITVQRNKTRNPYGFAEYWKHTVTPSDAAWLEHINKVCREHRVDIAQVEMPWRISDIFAIPDGIKKVYVHHELGFVRREQELATFGDSVYVRACKQFADRNEIGQLNGYDAIVTLSATDKEKLLNAGVRQPVHTSFAIIDSTTTLRPDQGNGKRLSFIGPSYHNPNHVGMTWFLEHCWARLKAECPDITLDIIGNWTEDHQTEVVRRYKDVRFLGYVEDLAAAIRDTTLIVPITIGSGIRMKILEAANKGVPFVSTHVGAEGIPVENGKHCFLADTPDDFVKGILKVQDPQLRQRFAANAYEMVQEHYSLAALRKNRLAIYESLFLSAE